MKFKVYADSRVNAFKEAGEILVPISEGVFTEAGVVAELAEMCDGTATLRESDDEITFFKSLGMAMSRLGRRRVGLPGAELISKRGIREESVCGKGDRGESPG